MLNWKDVTKMVCKAGELTLIKRGKDGRHKIKIRTVPRRFGRETFTDIWIEFGPVTK